jgi:hypothetical protein
MEKQSSLWQTILTEFQERKYFQNGLTLPFMIGCYHYFYRRTIAPNIADILFEMKTNPNPVSVIYCNGIREYVFALMDTESISTVEKYPHSFARIGNLIFSDGSIDDFSDLTKFSTAQEQRYKVYIDQQLFSKNNGVWGKFNNIDRKRLDTLKIKR